eukprot:scaffold1414_cov261-Pinguiococcus_pyrenoidosus.AAC.2
MLTDAHGCSRMLTPLRSMICSRANTGTQEGTSYRQLEARTLDRMVEALHSVKIPSKTAAAPDANAAKIRSAAGKPVREEPSAEDIRAAEAVAAAANSLATLDQGNRDDAATGEIEDGYRSPKAKKGKEAKDASSEERIARRMFRLRNRRFWRDK